MTSARHGTTAVVCISSTAWFARETHRNNNVNAKWGKTSAGAAVTDGEIEPSHQ